MKTTRTSAVHCACLAAGLAVAPSAFAQEVTRLPESAQQAVGLDTGLESAFIARATYAHRLDLGVLREMRIFARATLPVVMPDFGDWAVDAGLRATLFTWRDFRLAALTGPIFRNTSNDLYAATALGITTTIYLGYESDRWGLSAEGGYEQILSTHIRHSDLYRTTFYAGAKDGWYAVSGSSVHAGLRGGVRFGAAEIYAKLGIAATGGFNQTVPPFYGTVGSTYAF